MDISAFPQHDSIIEMFAAQNALIQQLQRENAELSQQLAESQAEVERLRGAINKVLPRLSVVVGTIPDSELSPEGYCDDEACPYCVLKKALSVPQPDDLGMDPNATCSICGNKLQIVRPGKYQCNHCEKEEHGKD